MTKTTEKITIKMSLCSKTNKKTNTWLPQCMKHLEFHLMVSDIEFINRLMITDKPHLLSAISTRWDWSALT